MVVRMTLSTFSSTFERFVALTKRSRQVFVTDTSRSVVNADKHACSVESLHSAVVGEMLRSKNLPRASDPPGLQCCRLQSCYFNADVDGALQGNWSGQWHWQIICHQCLLVFLKATTVAMCFCTASSGDQQGSKFRDSQTQRQIRACSKLAWSHRPLVQCARFT